MDFRNRRPTSEMWHVDVWLGGERILTIGHNHLAGDEMTPERVEAVRKAIRHLQGFIGDAPTEPAP